MSRQKEELAWLDHVLSGWIFSKAPHHTGVSETRAAVSPPKAICRTRLCLHIAIPLKLSPFQLKFPQHQIQSKVLRCRIQMWLSKAPAALQTAYLSTFGKRKRCRQSLLCDNKARSFSLPSQRAFGTKNCVSRKRNLMTFQFIYSNRDLEVLQYLCVNSRIPELSNFYSSFVHSWGHPFIPFHYSLKSVESTI